MICQKCGKCVDLKHTYLFRFSGKSVPINASWIICKPCAYSEYEYCLKTFGEIAKALHDDPEN